MATTKPALPQDAVWFITGCSSGIGAALAKHVGTSGHRLVATARNPTSLSYLPDSSPDKALKVSLDVTSSDSITAALDATLSHFGRIDVLENNAAYALFGDTESASEDQIRAQLETLFFGAANLTTQAMRIMREENLKNGGCIGGTIVQVSSVGGRMGAPGQAYYHAARVKPPNNTPGFTESVSKEVHPDWNISFLILEPSGVRSEFTKGGMVYLDSHPAYRGPNLPTNMLRAYMEDPNAHAGWADASTVAKVAFETMCDLNRPFRLLMGADAYGVFKGVEEARRREMQEWEVVSLGVSGHQPGAQSLSFLN